MAQHLEVRLETLTQFKQSGISLSALAQIEQLLQNPELVSLFQELAQQGITSPEQLEQALRERPDLREKLERAAVVGGQRSAVNIPPELRPLLQEISRLTRLSDMPRKVELCERALQLVRREDNPTLWGALQNEIANALAQNPLGNRADNLERAIEHYELALQVLTREAFPTDWAMTQNNLAIAYADRIRGERAENLERAIAHYELALQVYTREAFPREHRQTARNLGDAWVAKGDWVSARSAYARAIAAAEQLFRHAVDPTTQRTEAAELAALYDRDINACIHLSNVGQISKFVLHPARDALTSAEAARSRAFLKQLGLGDYPASPNIPPALLQRERDLIAQLRTIEAELASTPTHADRATELERTLVAQRRALQNEMDAVWDAMLQQGGEAARDYVALRRGETPTWDDLRALAEHLGKDTALIEFHNLADKIVAMVWRAGWDAPQLVTLPITRERLLYRYLLPYEQETLRYWYHTQVAHREIHNDWLALGEELLAPLVERRSNGASLLDDASLAYFIPHGYLHTLPLHALMVRGKPFIAERAVAYAPSAAVLARALTTADERPPTAADGQPSAVSGQALVMGYTSRAKERPTFIGEAVEVAKMFGVEPLVDTAATRAALTHYTPRSKLIHLSCHGFFESNDPLASYVRLADGDYTAREWMRLQLDADLVTLSACQLAFSDVNPGDDLVGMTRALLYAGAASVLLALWSVRSDTTMAWMRDFYARLQRGQAKAFAHREATLALYESHKDEPHIWAPFVLVG